MIKTKLALLKGRLLSSQLGNLKSFQKALIGWKKADLPKSHFCFDHVNRLIVVINFCQITWFLDGVLSNE